MRLSAVRAAALVIVFGLVACGQTPGPVDPKAAPTPRAVDQATLVGGGPQLPCEDPHAIIDRVGPASSLDSFTAWYVVDAVLSHRESSEQDAGSTYPTENVVLHVTRRVRGTSAPLVHMSPRSREDLEAWLSEGSSQRALIGQSGGDYATPFVVDANTVYELVPCAYPGKPLSSYVAQVGGDPLEALIALAAAGKGSATWQAWQNVAQPPPPKPKTWQELMPDERSLDVSSPVPAEIRRQLRGMTINFHGLTPEWRRMPIVAVTKVVGVAWNDATSLNASQEATLPYIETWLPGARLQLWAAEASGPAFRGLALIGEVPVSGRSGDVTLEATLDPTITTLEELKAAAAGGRSLVTWRP